MIDERTGNLVVAMGLDGVLLRIPDGRWQWVAVGPYHFRGVGQTPVLEFIHVEVVFAALLCVLLLPTIMFPAHKQSPRYLVMLVIGWLCWMAMFAEKDATEIHITDFRMLVYLTVTLILTIPILASGVADAQRRIPVGASAAIALIGAALFLLPYALWVRGTFPNYAMATTFALLLAYSAVMAGFINLRRYRFTPKKKKRDELITMVFQDEMYRLPPRKNELP